MQPLKNMNSTPRFRTNGAIGALLDEYEKSISELILVIQDISPNELIDIKDHKTKDEDCKSIQSILTHIVQSGYTYAIEVRRWFGENVDYKDKVTLSHANDYIQALNEMFNYNETLFKDYSDVSVVEYDKNKKIVVRWGQQYDIEQLFEHAIVHILRHRRQIEILKTKSL